MSDGEAALFLAGNRTLFDGLVEQRGLNVVETQRRQFPDGETYFRVTSDVSDRSIFLFCSLDRPDPKFLPMVYAAETLREEGANSVVLVAPYLAYMRQDKQFNPGEGVTSRYFARLVDRYFDGLMTVEPHLHRYESLDELYSLPNEVVHAHPAISSWIEKSVPDPFLIGPDSESEQWVSEIARGTGIPYTVLQKERHGDRDVEITFKDPEGRRDHTPVLVDDIISTASTMIKATRTLLENDYSAPICVGVHAIFAENAYEELETAGAKRIVTCNTIAHKSNGIDLSEVVSESAFDLSNLTTP